MYQSTVYGKVLVLDGVIQITDRDWMGYQEMITHLGALAHPSPRRVLIIGGGDGGVINEVLKHRSVEKVILCEIDRLVTEVCKEYFKQFEAGWKDPRLECRFEDGAKFLEAHPGEFDLIIVDSSDPVGPAESLYTQSFYQHLREALAPEGILVQQAENIWLHLDYISKVLEYCSGIFPSVDYAYTTIPTYPGGQIGFLLCSRAPSVDFRRPRRTPAEAFVPGATLQYYTPENHHASFILPAFARDRLRKFITATFS